METSTFSWFQCAITGTVKSPLKLVKMAEPTGGFRQIIPPDILVMSTLVKVE